MLCEKCQKREANVHFTEIINGKKKVLNVCDVCAKENNIGLKMDFEIPFSFKDIFSEFMDIGIKNDNYRVEEDVLCPKCKSTYKRFKDVGRLGCSDCYETFKSNLSPLVKRIQGSVKHTGKLPKRIAGPLKVKNALRDLKMKLNKAIADENFEEAAILRDKIRELERGM